ncbi:protein prune homolog 2 [Cimex lectularius]|uniref:CRAL-TRIO domain-containing protein n=1 Tax=Cimex lectularius TaxID=79782 RepID=A0A8I6RUR6_CIMLE|nr:protein prune homolog 2 [Cimex lectularius]
MDGTYCRTVMRHPLDSEGSSSADSPGADDASIGTAQEEAAGGYHSDPEEDKSLYQAVLSPDTQDCRLQKGNTRRRIIPFPEEVFSTMNPVLDNTLSQGFDSDDDLENSILEQISSVEPIAEYTAEEEREDIRSWRSVDLGNNECRIDMKVIEPYKRVLSHGGYLNSGSRNAIIVLSACFLPNRSRVDYNYVMENLSLYILATLNELVTDDYHLVYLHGGATKDCIPTFSWLRKYYQIIDKRLRKQLKKLYLVHPTLLLRTIVTMSKFVVSSKFLNKVHFIHSLAELYEVLPLEEASIPDRVCHYDRIKQSIQISQAV